MGSDVTRITPRNWTATGGQSNPPTGSESGGGGVGSTIGGLVGAMGACLCRVLLEGG